jgi:hypothetical protein
MQSWVQEIDIVIGSAKLQADHRAIPLYQAPAGFEPIVRSNTLWATLFRDLTDQQEIRVLKPASTPSLSCSTRVAKRSRSVRHRRRYGFKTNNTAA